MKLRATTVAKFNGPYGLPSVTGTMEVWWAEAWHVVSSQTYPETEWLLLVSLLIVGGRRAEVEVTHVDETSHATT